MDFVASTGVKHVFMLPGGGAMHLVDSLGKHPDLQYVCCLHEQACAVAADAYSQYTNNFGVALVTTGPGGTNAITGVAGAWLDSIPCMFISGQVKTGDRVQERGVRQMGFQEIDIVSLVAPITKYAVCVNDPKSIRVHLEKAYHEAKTGRPGPVWIDIPLDVQAAQVDETELLAYQPPQIEPDLSLPDKVRDAMDLLRAAERPVILVGNGVRLAKAVPQFLSLTELLRIPVLTTWKAIDFIPEDHPLFCGRPGALGQRGANFAQQNADCLFIIGARLDFGQTGYNHENFARAAKKIMVDVDPSEIRKMMTHIHAPICSDAGEFLDMFLEMNQGATWKAPQDWVAWCKERQSKYPVVQSSYWKETACVNQYVLVDALSQEMSGDDLLIPGSSGACSEATMQAFKVKAGMRIFNTEGLGPMGFGVPAAIGGCIASGGKTTVCVDGDGGFSMNIQELETVKRLGLPIKFFVLNNQGYGSIRATQRTYFNGAYVASDTGSGLTLPDSVRIADAYGLGAARIMDHTNILAQVREILDRPGPVVCNVNISPDQVSAPRLSSMQRADGTMVSKPLEDLWPFLHREEFRADMIIEPMEE